MAFSWDVEHLDTTVSPFTPVGSPSEADDQHNPSSTYAFDGTDDYLTSTDKTVAVGDTHFTLACWVWQDAAEGGSRTFLNNRAVSPGTDNYFYFQAEANGRITLGYQGNSLFKASRSSIGDMDYAQWVHIISSANMTSGDVTVYKNGVETSYSAQNTGTLTGVSMADRTLAVTSVYMNSYSNGITGKVSRPKITSGTTTAAIISGAEALTEYNAEVAAIGEGFGDAYNHQVLLTTLFS